MAARTYLKDVLTAQSAGIFQQSLRRKTSIENAAENKKEKESVLCRNAELLDGQIVENGRECREKREQE